VVTRQSKRDARLIVYRRKEVYIEKSCKTMEQNGVRVHSSRVLGWTFICTFLASYFATKGREINSAFLNNWPLHVLMQITRRECVCTRIRETVSYGP
jgi:hypothetical protein